ncbi:MAG TPA: hypothetical protein VD947_00710 [Patescibacteria group bacterium]|nr:hypothetical protein [Patescibacteria group bacterium]
MKIGKLLRNQHGTVVLGELILVIIVLGIAGFAGYKIQNENNKNKNTPSSQNIESKDKTKEKISKSKAENCTDISCFEEKFAKCEAAKLNYINPFASVYYEIYGPQNDGCRMLFRYTKNPNPAWENQDIICTWDNKINFQESVEKTFNNLGSGINTTCEGPLVPILQNPS